MVKLPTSKFKILEISMIYMEGKNLPLCLNWYSSIWKLLDNCEKRMVKQLNLNSQSIALIPQLKGSYSDFILFLNAKFYNYLILFCSFCLLL